MPANMEEMRKKVHLNEFTVMHTANTDYPGTYPGVDDSWDINKFKKGFSIRPIKMNATDLEFDMVGCDVSLANAFRRILIADVPSMAPEKILIYNNTSIIQDEVLAHRLGLIPILADPREFQFPPTLGEDEKYDPEKLDEKTHIVFHLKVKCTRNPGAPEGATNPDLLYQDTKITTAYMKWIPIGDQEQKFGPNGIRPVHDDILLAKLRPGQEIDLVMHCMKGVGGDHAKFSPVATATYRLLLEITLLQPISGERAQRLAKCFSAGVISLEEVNGILQAHVADPRCDTGSREVFRDKELKDLVKMERVRDHFIFSIESTGALPPDILMSEAVKILQAKCKHFLSQLRNS